MGPYDSDLAARLAATTDVAAELLRTACKAQNAANILLARRRLAALAPLDLVALAESTIDMNDEWEYRRLLELAKEVDEHALRRLVQWGLRHADDSVAEAAVDFARVPLGSARTITHARVVRHLPLTC